MCIRKIINVPKEDVPCVLFIQLFFKDLNKLDTGKVEAYQIYLLLFIVAYYFCIPNCDIRYCYWLFPNGILIFKV